LYFQGITNNQKLGLKLALIKMGIMGPKPCGRKTASQTLCQFFLLSDILHIFMLSVENQLT